MMSQAYDHQTAQRLLPLVTSIGIELSERLHEVRILQGSINLRERNGDIDDELLDLRAQLANHRREIRYAGKELERLGCAIDQNQPGRILIPGADGEVAHGYTWAASDPTLRRVQTGTAC